VTARVERITFPGSQGAELSARLDLPATPTRAYALFAHCFTCTKEVVAASRIARELTEAGIGVLRFDFTGLGGSGGDFASTNFSSNTDDIRLAAEWLRVNRRGPQLMIGHSLGGSAVLAVAGEIEEVRAVVTIAAPADLDRVAHLFAGDLHQIETEGQARVRLAGRTFSIRKQFVDDLRSHDLLDRIACMRKPLLILHSPVDEIVGIEQAERIFAAARHPKSYVSLDHADHLLTARADAAYAAGVMAAWAGRYLADESAQSGVPESSAQVVVVETTQSPFLQQVVAGEHRFFADEPVSLGGSDAGPSPYDLLAAGLGACTSMTLRLFADRHRIPLGRVMVEVDHARVHATDCERCVAGDGTRIDAFDCRVHLEGDLTLDDRAQLLAIANRCPVHRTLEMASNVVVTEVPKMPELSTRTAPSDRKAQA
jgi:putative redox protein